MSNRVSLNSCYALAPRRDASCETASCGVLLVCLQDEVVDRMAGVSSKVPFSRVLVGSYEVSRSGSGGG